MKRSGIAPLILALSLALAACGPRYNCEVVYEGPAGPVEASARALAAAPIGQGDAAASVVPVPCELPAPIERISALDGSDDIMLNVSFRFSDDVELGPGINANPPDPATMFGLYYFEEPWSGWVRYVFYIPDIVRTEYARAIELGRCSWTLNPNTGDAFWWYLRSYVDPEVVGGDPEFWYERAQPVLETIGSRILTAQKYPDHPELQLPVPDGATAPIF